MLLAAPDAILDGQPLGAPVIAPASSPVIEVRSLRKSFGSHQALAGLGLSLAPGEFVSILGPSGCGKTTLLHVVAGMIERDAGEVLIGGQLAVKVTSRLSGLIAPARAMSAPNRSRTLSS